MPVGRQQGRRGCRAAERMSSRSMRVGEAWSDVELESADEEPLAGVGDPAGPLDQQAADGGGPAARAARRRSAPRSPRAETLPSVSKSAGRRRASARTSSSCSSKISPTSSSSRSSSVAMPSVPPNSSSTTARWRRSRCMSSSRSPQLRLAGVTATGRTGSGSPGCSLNRSNACSMPTISSSVPRKTGIRL